MSQMDWTNFEVVSLNPDGSLQRVRCKRCNWGHPKGVSANTTRCRLHIEKKHGSKARPSVEDDVSDDGTPEEASQEAAQPDQEQQLPPEKKRKLVQAQLQAFADRGFKVWQSDHASELLLKFKVWLAAFGSFGLSYHFLTSGTVWAFVQLLGLRGVQKLLPLPSCRLQGAWKKGLASQCLQYV